MTKPNTETANDTLTDPQKAYALGVSHGLQRAADILRKEFRHQKQLREVYAARIEREAQK